MRQFLSLLSLLSLSLTGVANAGCSCVAFDTQWNLLAFGFNGKDYIAGTQDKWSSGTAQEITTTGRPPFNTDNADCYLSQFYNAIYVLGADKVNPSSIYIYDATAKSWSTQAVNPQEFDPSSFSAILDHDTNIFYALSKGKLFSLDMLSLKAATSNTLTWNVVQDPGFGSDYSPVMALAQNHVHFLNMPGVPAGSAKIFVIHYSSLQKDPQSYGNFPATHGQVTSFFQDSGVQQEFAFVPDDGYSTYVINVETNTTRTLPGPTVKDSLATYFASTKTLVQLTSSGKVWYLPYDGTSGTSGTWSPVTVLPAATSSSASELSPTGSGSPLPKPTASSGHVSNADSAKGNANGASSLDVQTRWKMAELSIILGLAIKYLI